MKCIGICRMSDDPIIYSITVSHGGYLFCCRRRHQDLIFYYYRTKPVYLAYVNNRIAYSLKSWICHIRRKDIKQIGLAGLTNDEGLAGLNISVDTTTVVHYGVVLVIDLCTANTEKILARIFIADRRVASRYIKVWNAGDRDRRARAKIDTAPVTEIPAPGFLTWQLSQYAKVHQYKCK